MEDNKKNLVEHVNSLPSEEEKLNLADVTLTEDSDNSSVSMYDVNFLPIEDETLLMAHCTESKGNEQSEKVSLLFQDFIVEFERRLEKNKSALSKCFADLKKKRLKVEAFKGEFSQYYTMFSNLVAQYFNISTNEERLKREGFDPWMERVSTVENEYSKKLEEYKTIIKEYDDTFFCALNKIYFKNVKYGRFEECFVENIIKSHKFFLEFLDEKEKIKNVRSELFDIIIDIDREVNKIDEYKCVISNSCCVNTYLLKTNISKRGYNTIGVVLKEISKNPEFSKKTIALLSVYLLRNIFSGKINFYIFNSNEEEKKYSFKECYDKFSSSIFKDNEVRFDVISPQYMPSDKNSGECIEKKFGTFYNYSNEQWEFHLGENYKAFTLESIKNLPPANSFYCEDVMNFVSDEHILHRIDGKTNSLYIRDDEECSFVKSQVHFENIYTESNDDVHRLIKYGFEKDSKYSFSANCHTIAFVRYMDTIMMLSKKDAHAYDKRFYVYFDFIREIIGTDNEISGSMSYMFYIFLWSFGINLKFKGEYTIKDESISGYFKQIYTQNLFLFLKMSRNIINSIINCPMLKNDNDVFTFLSQMYIKDSDFLNFNERYKTDISSIEKDTKFRNSMISFDKKRRNSDKEIFPTGLTANDVLLYLMSELNENEFKYCLTAVSLHFNVNELKINEIVEKFFPLKKPDCTPETRSKVNYKKQDEIYQYLNKNKKKILDFASNFRNIKY